MKRILAALLIAGMPLSAVPMAAVAADSPKAQAAAPDVQKELQKLMEAYGQGAISAKEYKARKEALLASKK